MDFEDEVRPNENEWFHVSRDPRSAGELRRIK